MKIPKPFAGLRFTAGLLGEGLAFPKAEMRVAGHVMGWESVGSNSAYCRVVETLKSH